MAAEEDGHRRQLIELFRSRFGEHIPQVRRKDVKGSVQHKKLWHVLPLGIEVVRKQAQMMEQDAARFYRLAAERTTDASVRKLLGDLAAAEDSHGQTAGQLEERHLSEVARAKEDDDASRRFVLQIVQPGLVGLMDGSVSTLAPVFAAAFGTHNTWNAFQVGLAASLGAGISMGFAEALADDGKLSGRGTPYLRGLVCGLMTIAGGIGHNAALPHLQLRHGDDRCRDRGRDRAARDRLDPMALHGHVAGLGGGEGYARWRAGPRDRHPDWRRLKVGDRRLHSRPTTTLETPCRRRSRVYLSPERAS